MKSIYEFETDADAVSAGRWFDLKIGRTQIGRVKLRPAMTSLNAAWRSARMQMFKDIAAEVVERQVEKGDELPESYQTQVLAEAVYGTVVTEYELYDRDGETLLDVSRETFVDLMKRAPIVLDGILEVAERFANFQIDEEKGSGKD